MSHKENAGKNYKIEQRGTRDLFPFSFFYLKNPNCTFLSIKYVLGQ